MDKWTAGCGRAVSVKTKLCRMCTGHRNTLMLQSCPPVFYTLSSSARMIHHYFPLWKTYLSPATPGWNITLTCSHSTSISRLPESPKKTYIFNPLLITSCKMIRLSRLSRKPSTFFFFESWQRGSNDRAAGATCCCWWHH